MPQMGHWPGWSIRICGCMEQVQTRVAEVPLLGGS